MILARISGRGSDQRRKNIINGHIEHSRLFHNLSRVTNEEYKKIVDASFEMLEANLGEEISNIMRDCNSVVAEAGQLPEAQQEPTLASALELEIDEAEGILHQAQSVLETVSSEHVVEAQP